MEQSIARMALASLLAVLFLYMVSNVATRDYRREAKDLLRKVGREEAADTLVPSTARQATLDRLTLEQQVQQQL